MEPSPRPGKILAKSWPIEHLPGLSPDHQARLKEVGIQTTQHLLQRTHHLDNHRAIAAQLRVHPQHLTKWIALARLAQIPSVGCTYCGTLLHAGIASPEQLAQASLPRLHQQILKLHVATMQSQEHCPSLSDIVLWQHQAQRLTRLF